MPSLSSIFGSFSADCSARLHRGADPPLRRSTRAFQAGAVRRGGHIRACGGARSWRRAGGRPLRWHRAARLPLRAPAGERGRGGALLRAQRAAGRVPAGGGRGESGVSCANCCCAASGAARRCGFSCGAAARALAGPVFRHRLRWRGAANAGGRGGRGSGVKARRRGASGRGSGAAAASFSRAAGRTQGGDRGRRADGMGGASRAGCADASL